MNDASTLTAPVIETPTLPSSRPPAPTAPWYANGFGWAVLAYSGLIFWLSNQSSIVAPMPFPSFDKFVHLTAYGMLGLLLSLALREQWARWGMSITATVVLLIGSLYGVSDEFHQSFVPGRQCDVWDWAADTTGVLLAMAVYVTARRAKTRWSDRNDKGLSADKDR